MKSYRKRILFFAAAVLTDMLTAAVGSATTTSEMTILAVSARAKSSRRLDRLIFLLLGLTVAAHGGFIPRDLAPNQLTKNQ